MKKIRKKLPGRIEGTQGNMMSDVHEVKSFRKTAPHHSFLMRRQTLPSQVLFVTAGSLLVMNADNCRDTGVVILSLLSCWWILLLHSHFHPPEQEIYWNLLWYILVFSLHRLNTAKKCYCITGEVKKYGTCPWSSPVAFFHGEIHVWH